MRTLIMLALIKGLVIGFVVFAVTNSVLDTFIISITSAIITGVFLIANTLIQHNLMRRDVVDRQEQIMNKVDELRSTMTQGEEA